MQAGKRNDVPRLRLHQALCPLALHEPQGGARRSARADILFIRKRRTRSDAPYRPDKFMVSMRVKIEMEPTHEPSVAAVCDRRSHPAFDGAHRDATTGFMAPTHVRIWEVFAFHEPGLGRAIPTLSHRPTPTTLPGSEPATVTSNEEFIQIHAPLVSFQ